ncbi:MAG: hypothetical protein IIZ26_00835 [Oscillospiraceae bacterium]|nr:hypothetical protein [Oscillospiraceae bacterium]
MFGYVRPALDKLDEENRDRFQAAYCGLCHTLGRRYGLVARMFLNYDLTFLAMLLDTRCDSRACHCLVHPIRKRPCACQSAALDTAADLSVILLWWQLQDGIADHGFWKGLKYRAASLLLRRAYRKACKLRPDFDEGTRGRLDELSRLEQENCASLDRPADCFARLLAQASQGEPDPIRRRVLEQMLYHLGRWIYLVDAADDLKKDLRQGNYNPVALRFSHAEGVLTEESREELGRTLDQSVRMMAAAFELADFGEYEKVIESTVYAGLYLVGAAVLNGTFHQKRTRDKQ